MKETKEILGGAKMPDGEHNGLNHATKNLDEQRLKTYSNAEEPQTVEGSPSKDESLVSHRKGELPTLQVLSHLNRARRLVARVKASMRKGKKEYTLRFDSFFLLNWGPEDSHDSEPDSNIDARKLVGLVALLQKLFGLYGHHGNN